MEVKTIPGSHTYTRKSSKNPILLRKGGTRHIFMPLNSVPKVHVSSDSSERGNSLNWLQLQYLRLVNLAKMYSHTDTLPGLIHYLRRDAGKRRAPSFNFIKVNLAVDPFPCFTESKPWMNEWMNALFFLIGKPQLGARITGHPAHWEWTARGFLLHLCRRMSGPAQSPAPNWVQFSRIDLTHAQQAE